MPIGPARNHPSGQGAEFVAAPQLSLPKGGGALRGVGESFSASPANGAASLSVPIAASLGRAGFGPQLSLTYDSAGGCGPFGLGWSLSVAAITRRTDRGLPLYDDGAHTDIFLLSGAEDLVLVIENGEHAARSTPRSLNGVAYEVWAYRPRIESLFARIERWTNPADPSDMFWRTISRDNLTTWYGRTENSRVADPGDTSGARIFSWLACEIYDDRGQVMVWRYKAEDDKRIDLSQACERNRDSARTAARYPKRVFYGARTPYFPDHAAAHPVPLPTDWCFELVFDYGEHDSALPLPAEGPIPWPPRPDPTSSYRQGFEVRSYRLCRRALMFHHFPGVDGVGADCLVRSTDFAYAAPPSADKDTAGPFYSMLASVTHTSWRREGAGYGTASLPSLEFGYSTATIDPAVGDVRADNLPEGVDGSRFQWVDLDGEGLPGVLSEEAGAWLYQANLGDARVGAAQVVSPRPATAALRSGRQQLMDLAGGGQLDLVELDGPLSGFQKRREDGGWSGLKPFLTLPVIDFADPQLRYVDLTGDGHADLLITEDDAIVWHESLAEDGFGPRRAVGLTLDEETSAQLLVSNPVDAIFLADMSGDGLSDLARVREGEVCWWPNLGYGRFGAKVTMDRAPRLGAGAGFDPRRVRLADIDGSGTSDLIYFGEGGVQIAFNQCGNSWIGERVLSDLPPVDLISTAAVMDLFGSGTAALVWSSPLPADSRRPMRFVNLMAGPDGAPCKPHLLVRIDNNLGAETLIDYAPSTRFYLADKLAGRPWITRLPFPVQVVERVTLLDHIARNRFTTRYAYHHGFYDRVEREFRGFGMVEQWDAEAIGALGSGAAIPQPLNEDPVHNLPPVLTKTWFHTGIYVDGQRSSAQFRQEYWREGDASDGLAGLLDPNFAALLLPDSVLPAGWLRADGQRVAHDLSEDEIREACRALKGSILRQEVYGLHGGDAADRPYSVSERNYAIELLQPMGPNPHAVCFAHPLETLGFHYERRLYKVTGETLADPDHPPPDARDAADPRLSHTVVLAVDAWGDVLETVAIGYGRRFRDPALATEDQDRQRRALATYAAVKFTNPVLEPDAHRAPHPCETTTYELVNMAPLAGARLLSLAQVRTAVEAANAAAEIAYEDQLAAGVPAGQVRKRPIERQRMLFRPDDLGAAAGNTRALLGPGVLQPRALAGESFRLAFTPGLLAQTFDRDGAALTPALAVLLGRGGDQGGYVDLDGDGRLWIPSGRAFHHPDGGATAAQEMDEARQGFFLARRYENPFGAVATAAYDLPHTLNVTNVTDAVGNRIAATYDYRLLQTSEVIDPNGNRSQAAFDILGLVAGTAVLGKADEALGDNLGGFVDDPSPTQTSAFFNDPALVAAGLLGAATTRIVYDMDRFRLSRAAHPDDPTQWLPAVAATIARETHTSDPAPVDGLKLHLTFGYSDGQGRAIQMKAQAEAGPLTDGGPSIPRWITTGWTVFNNKGLPVRTFEPFFSGRSQFEFGVQVGVGPVLFYDPVGRVTATLHPDHVYEKGLIDPWRLTSFDANDTVALDPRTDPDVAGYVTPHLAAEPGWQTWLQTRVGAPAGSADADAAAKAQLHADTPAVTHFDSLGRAMLMVMHNRFLSGGATIDQLNETRTVLDIEGNVREVRDPGGRAATRYAYDMLGAPIRQSSLEAGERWMLNDVDGKPIRGWNNRNYDVRSEYDALRRPVRSFVVGGDPAEAGGQAFAAEMLCELTIYGDSAETGLIEAERSRLNLRGKVFQHFDSAGVTTFRDVDPETGVAAAYDFKGNLLRSRRQFAQDHKAAPDWSQPATRTAVLAAEAFTSSSRYDALNRVVMATAPDASVYRPRFNAAGLLERVEVNLRGARAGPDPVWTTYVANIDYNARRQRTLIAYGCGARTTYAYDAQTFRLTELKTVRPAGLNGPAAQIFQAPETVQNLAYAFDPVGNITRIVDAALKTTLNGHMVQPACGFTYDALYRLVAASGREHIGQSGFQFDLSRRNCRDLPFVGSAQLGDLQALRNYTERYEYDVAGNITAMRHVAENGAWTRTYDYEDASLLAPADHSNRLTRTHVQAGGDTFTEPYAHDRHGNMTSAPHLTLMGWNYRDQLRATSRQVVNDPAPGQAAETTYYVYDAAGQRARKVTERADGALKNERIYLGGFEIYREFTAGAVSLERQTLHVMDDKQRIALVETRTVADSAPVAAPAPVHRYQFGNHLGSACLELDEAAALIAYEEYSPYGTTTFQAGRSAAEVSLKRYRYTGKERDEETGFGYHGARYYAPWLGRWVSCDPIWTEGGLNLYAYGANNPVHFSDPSGLAPKKYETQRGKDTAAKTKEMQQNLSEAKKAGRIPDPMQKRAQKLAAERGKTPIEQHHHRGVAQAAKVKLDPKKMGQDMSSVWSTKADRAVTATVDGKPATHHNAAKSLDFAEQAKVPKTAAGLEQASKISKERLPATADMTQRAEMDWAKSQPAGPKVSPKTGEVVTPRATNVSNAARRGSQGGFLEVPRAGTVLKAAEGVGVVVSLGVEPTPEKTHESLLVGAVATGVGMLAVNAAKAHPEAALVIAAAAGGAFVGYVAEEQLGVSNFSAAHGKQAEDLARRAGAGDGLATAVGIAGTIGSTGPALVEAATVSVINWMKK